MKSFNIQLLNAIFFLGAAQKKEMCFNPEDGEIYEVKSRSKENATLLSLNGGEAPILDFSPDKLIFRSDILNRSEKYEKLSAFNSIEIGENQIIVQGANSIDTDPKEGILDSNTDQAQAFIGIGKVNVPRFSVLYTGETAKWSYEVENLLDKIFAATNKTQTIEKTLENYYNAKKLAKEGKIYELKQIAERLQGRINKQSAMMKGKDTMAAQTQAKRKMLISAAIAATAALLYFGIPHIIPKTTDTQVKTEFYSATLSTNSELDAAIAEWERTTGKKIYPAGRKCLEKNCKGMSKAQIIRVINQNIK